ncbi:MAG: dihydrofolate reductase [Tidjanibacter sp.]|nr:dihydrofolate reductase [Tidjanibacter sp.]MBR3931266.1 dihydrofolate reductase [Tidjanibacter sp.]
MKKVTLLIASAMIALLATSCSEQNTAEFRWQIDNFDDIKILRYQVHGFEQLSLEQKELIYYLNQAAISGRDIMFDQNFKYNLAIRRTLEAIYQNYTGDKECAEWKAFEKYLKKVWFANGIHHHYSNDKFKPEFSQEYFENVLVAQCAATIPNEGFESQAAMMEIIVPAIFDPELYPSKLVQADGVDVLKASSMNYYEGVSQAEAERFYAKMAKKNDPRPISYGLNSKLVKEGGKIYEKTYKLGGMYSDAIEQIIYWLEKAAGVAQEPQKSTLLTLVEYYKTGDLRLFDQFNIAWTKDTESYIDYVNGFTEDYGDPLGRKGAWESIVNFKNDEATLRTKIISDNAQWFEDNAPINPAFRKAEVKGVSAKVITAATLAGDAYPATPIGINLPNADWIRKEHGSKSVTIDNITEAYAESAHGNGFDEEFILRKEDRQRIEEYGRLGDNLHTDIHECLGHGSGQLAPGTKGGELKQYSSTLEEARADLFGLYYLGDPKLVELGLVPSFDVAKAQYAEYIMNGMMTQFTRIELGKNVEESHMRNRKLIAEWCYEHGKAENVIEWVVENGKRYVVVNDFERLRTLFGEMLYEVQRIKSEGDFEAGRDLVEKYAVKIDPDLHKEVLERYATLNIQPYAGFINPIYTLVEEDGKVVDVKIEYPDNYIEQMLYYSNNYSFLPTLN